MNQNPAGLILIDKSINFTSHHIVAHVRRTLKKNFGKEIKVGHLGTLDPFATGLLPILVGGVTRLSDELMDGKKQYLFEVTLGQETDTLDNTGQITREADIPSNAEEQLKKQILNFIGEIEQIPPAYSALKMNGRPLYEYMRAEGKLPSDIETKKRKIVILALDLISFSKVDNKTQATFRVKCEKGTYVRSLARDLALSIGTVGHCSSLRREWVEPWHVNDALLFSEESKPDFDMLINALIGPEALLPSYPKITLPSHLSKMFTSGNIVSVSENELSYDKKQEEKSATYFAQNFEQNTLYLCHSEQDESGRLKIKPFKKIY
jgi:tRNA pseudouridine55 synthase